MKTGPQLIANLILNGLVPQLKRAKLEIEQSPVTPEQIALLAAGIEAGVINFSEAKQKIREVFDATAPQAHTSEASGLTRRG